MAAQTGARTPTVGEMGWSWAGGPTCLLAVGDGVEWRNPTRLQKKCKRTKFREMADISAHRRKRSGLHATCNLPLTLPKVTTKISDSSLAVRQALWDAKIYLSHLILQSRRMEGDHDPIPPKARALSLIQKCDLLSMAFCHSFSYVIPRGFPWEPHHPSSDRCPSLRFLLCPAVSLASDKQWLSCQLPNYRTV